MGQFGFEKLGISSSDNDNPVGTCRKCNERLIRGLKKKHEQIRVFLCYQSGVGKWLESGSEKVFEKDLGFNSNFI